MFNATILAVWPPNAFPESLKALHVGLPSRRSSRAAVPHPRQQSFYLLGPPARAPDPRVQCAALLYGIAREEAMAIATVRLAFWRSWRLAPVHPAAAVRHPPEGHPECVVAVGQPCIDKLRR